MSVTSSSTPVDTRKKTEAETLATFQEELPSQYFSHKGEEEYRTYTTEAERIYRDLFKFPPQMFNGASLIDFGAGTGENTIYLANWGASCTLVEMNHLAQDVSKEVFAKYAKRPDDHTFVNTSIFDYAPDAPHQYDIVHCRGVLSHTAAKEEAFEKIASFLKPGGYLIFGDPNKAGGFQNMLQRYAVYSFASTPDEMVDVSEVLFKEDIDRSQATVPRTRRAIIFDRWVIQSQDDPSVGEVLAWAAKSGLKLYSCYPPILPGLMGNSLHHQPALTLDAVANMIPIAELVWMMQTESDTEFLRSVNEDCGAFADSFKAITDYVANLNTKSKIDHGEFNGRMSKLNTAFGDLSVHSKVKAKLNKFSEEAIEFINIVQAGDLGAVRKFIENTDHLFKGACGNRHVDFIVYKPND